MQRLRSRCSPGSFESFWMVMGQNSVSLAIKREFGARKEIMNGDKHFKTMVYKWEEKGSVQLERAPVSSRHFFVFPAFSLLSVFLSSTFFYPVSFLIFS